MTAGSRAAQADGRTRATTVVDDRRERILDAAETLFAEHGFRNVSVRDVAEAADITHPLIYYYWKSKDGLLAATLERSQRRITELPDDADRQRMAAAIARAALQHNRPYLLMLIHALLDGMPPSDWPGASPRSRPSSAWRRTVSPRTRPPAHERVWRARSPCWPAG